MVMMGSMPYFSGVLHKFFLRLVIFLYWLYLVF
jgi:hypothetical protein